MTESKDRSKTELLAELAKLKADFAALEEKQRQTEKSLSRVAQAFEDERHIFASGPVVVFKWQNAPAWPVEYVSVNVKEIFGYSADAFLKGEVSYANIVSPADYERVAKEIQTAAKSGASHFEHKPYRIIRRDGEIVWLNDLTTIMRSKEGRLTHFLGYVVDITERIEAAEQLKQQTVYLNKLFDNIPEAIVLSDGTGKILRINKEFTRLFGYIMPDTVGYALPDLIVPPNLSEEGYSYLSKVLRGERVDAESFRRHKDGHNIQVSILGVPVDMPDGQLGVYAIYRDISKRKKTEKALHQQLSFSKTLNTFSESVHSEERPHIILETMVQIAGETLQVECCRVFNINLDENLMSGLNVWHKSQTLSPNTLQDTYTLDMFIDAARYMEKTRQPLESHIDDVNVYLQKRGAVEFIHQELNVKSLLWYPFAFSLQGYFLLAFYQVESICQWQQQELDFIEAMARLVNIALLKIRFLEAQQETTTQLSRLAVVVEQSSEMIIITDTAGVIEYANPAFEKITGFSAAEAIGETPQLLRNDNIDTQTYEALWQTISSGKPWYMKFVNRRKDGSEYDVEGAIFPIKNETGQIINYCQISRDITREQELEARLQQSQKIEAVGRLAGGIAHDFNNLLTAINGYASLALMKLEPDTLLYHDLTQILNAGEKAGLLTRQLLAFSRNEVYQPKLLDLNLVVSESLPLFHRLIGEDININTNLSPGIPFIKADKSKIEQVLMNLLINARDAVNDRANETWEKEIVIETGQINLDEHQITNYPNAQAGLHIVLRISDNGAGMNEDTKSLIFDPFFTTKEVGKGTGLGLSTVYGIVKQSQGHIDVSSEPNKGTTMTIYWPAATGDATAPELAVSANEATLFGNETILLAEDDVGVREFTSRILKDFGYTVYEATNGKHALALIAEQNLKIDLLLTDVIMPVMNGKELAKNVKEILPASHILFVSGYTDSQIAFDDILEFGSDILFKPYSRHALAKTVREMFDQPVDKTGSGQPQ